jgi:hypothetical protein
MARAYLISPHLISTIPPGGPNRNIHRPEFLNRLQKEKRTSWKPYRNKERRTDLPPGTGFVCGNPSEDLPVGHDAIDCCHRPDYERWFEINPKTKVLHYVTRQCQANRGLGQRCKRAFYPCKRVTDELGVDRYVRLLDVATISQKDANKWIAQRQPQ